MHLSRLWKSNIPTLRLKFSGSSIHNTFLGFPRPQRELHSSFPLLLTFGPLYEFNLAKLPTCFVHAWSY